MTTTTKTPQFGKGARVTGAARAAAAEVLVARYGQGVSVRALAAQFERSYGWVHRMLAESGVQFRPRGGGRIRGKRAQS